MHSSYNNQDHIRRQIALLQAQLIDANTQSPPNRKRPSPTLLAPATPSPKKRKIEHDTKQPPRKSGGLHKRPSTRPPNKPYPDLPPSNVLNNLAILSRPSTSKVQFVRSSAFTDKPDSPQGQSDAPKRDDRLALVEDLEPGPCDHNPPFDDPHFEQLEPNSGIRLTSRVIPHDDVQEYLRGRYYLSPSRLYSVARLLPDKHAYDVPVAGDWVTIAVVAERGPVKFSQAPVGVGTEDDDDAGQRTTRKDRDLRRSNVNREPKPNGKKYVNIKLIDFGARSRSSSATGGKAVLRGDAFLTLLLFEADGFDTLESDDGGRATKVYKGGSRGAFEAMSKLKEGDVIALLNPRILKPFQRTTQTPHPTTNILALTPESASSIAVIGRARDLGMCTAMKRDGKICGGWCDKRISDVCEWHVQSAVQSRRAGRAEFSIGTSGMSSVSTHKRKQDYDPARQWGLKPQEPEKDPATYVFSGHVVGGSGTHDPSILYIAETMGREGQAKARRKLTGKDADLALNALLKRDKEGMKPVVKAREVAMRLDKRGGKGERGTETVKDQKDEGATIGKNMDVKELEPKALKNSYSANVIKHLGFDPAAKAGHRRVNDSAIQKKLDTLAAVHSSKKDVELGPRPGPRIRSGVFAPPNLASRVDIPRDTHRGETDQPLSSTSNMIDLDDV